MQELSPYCHEKKGWGLNANLSDRLAEKLLQSSKKTNPRKDLKSSLKASAMVGRGFMQDTNTSERTH